jgi:UTP--glucose-1-phosphate uridylyltransferase
VILADDLIAAEPSVVAQMIAQHERHHCSILAVEEVPRSETNKYGIVATQAGSNGELLVTSIVEKPAPEVAPSNLAVVGRYLLTPRIFDKLEGIGRGAGGEIQLTDGIAALLEDERVIAYPFHGKRYDCGSKLGYLEATVELALAHEDLGEDFKVYLRRLAESGVCS